MSQKFRFISKTFHHSLITSNFDYTKAKTAIFKHEYHMVVKKDQAKSFQKDPTKPLKKSDSRQKGSFGEKIAKKYLQKKGYGFIQNNYHIHGGEIDLIMEKDGIIVFVEVKLRCTINYGSGRESINRSKKQKLLKAIFTFLQAKNNHQNWQLDLIDIFYQKFSNTAEVTHIPNILET